MKDVRADLLTAILRLTMPAGIDPFSNYAVSLEAQPFSSLGRWLPDAPLSRGITLRGYELSEAQH